MKKRILSVLLALCLALTLLPAAALAAGTLPPEETEYWDNLTRQEADDTLLSIQNETASSDIVFIYYKVTGCWNSTTYVPQYAAFANEKHVNVCAYAYDPAATAGDGTGLNRVFSLLGKNSLTFPAVITYNAETREYQAADSVTSMTAFQNQLQTSGLDIGSPDGEGGEPIQPVAMSPQEWEVLRLTNQHRMAMGLEPLSTFDSLQKVAELRAEELLEVLSHDRPDGTSCFTAYSEYWVSYNTAAENIAAGQTTAAWVMDSWLNSSGHRANIESLAVTHLGVGCRTKSEGYGIYWSQNFAGAYACGYSGLRLSQSSVSGVLGTDLETLLTQADIAATAVCAEHGACTLPLIAAMCTGYDPNVEGEQTVTVRYGDASAELTVSLVDVSAADQFTDVDASDPGNWYALPVVWAVANGITQGTSATTFSPDAICTRAQIVTFLYRAAGEPDVDKSSAAKFTDVDLNDYYAAPVAWAVAQGITVGMTETTFAPDENCTRAQIVTFLHRYEGEPAATGTNSFTDVAPSAYYAVAVNWAVERGITVGTTATTFSPDDGCTRAQIVTFLYRDMA